MKKKIISFALVATTSLFALTSFGSCKNSEDMNNRFKYTLLEDGTYEIALDTKVAGVNFLGDWVRKRVTEIVIPEEYEGKPVTSIADGGFMFCSNLTSVEIPNTVTSIGQGAFMFCGDLTSVEIPDSVTSIGIGAFMFCGDLENVVIGDSLTTISDGAFAFCMGLTSVEMSNAVTTLSDSAFWICNSMTSVYYKGNAEDWTGMNVLSGNADLTDATIYYYSENEPEETGNYWHYDENGVAVIW